MALSGEDQLSKSGGWCLVGEYRCFRATPFPVSKSCPCWAKQTVRFKKAFVGEYSVLVRWPGFVWHMSPKPSPGPNDPLRNSKSGTLGLNGLQCLFTCRPQRLRLSTPSTGYERVACAGMNSAPWCQGWLNLEPPSKHIFQDSKWRQNRRMEGSKEGRKEVGQLCFQSIAGRGWN